MTASVSSLRLEARLTPRASRDLVEGWKLLSDGRRVLAVRVRAVPEKGAANEALLGLLAKTCGVGRSRVSLIAGAASRLKSIRVEGDPAKLTALLGLHLGNSRCHKDAA